MSHTRRFLCVGPRVASFESRDSGDLLVSLSAVCAGPCHVDRARLPLELSPIGLCRRQVGVERWIGWRTSIGSPLVEATTLGRRGNPTSGSSRLSPGRRWRKTSPESCRICARPPPRRLTHVASAVAGALLMWFMTSAVHNNRSCVAFPRMGLAPAGAWQGPGWRARPVAAEPAGGRSNLRARAGRTFRSQVRPASPCRSSWGREGSTGRGSPVGPGLAGWTVLAPVQPASPCRLNRRGAC